MISPTIRPYLDDLEARIDPEEEARLLQQWMAFNNGQNHDPIFSPQRSAPCPPRIEWPWVSVNRALADFDAMALQQFGACSAMLADGSGLLLPARCNYGSSILPSLFGVEHFIMDEAMDTLPTSRPLNDVDAIRRLVERGIPDFHTGWGAQVLEMSRRYAEIALEYPTIGRWVFIYHPDLQGPLDTCEVLWGASMFYALYDQPDLVHTLLDLVTETYIRFMQAWQDIIPVDSRSSVHWGFGYTGTLMLRDDSAMNLSPRMFGEFVQPYDQHLLEVFGGGAIHFCGRGDHYIAQMGTLRGLHAINLSQPELNNMETIFAHTIDQGINLLGLEREAAETALCRGRDLHGRVHCS